MNLKKLIAYNLLLFSLCTNAGYGADAFETSSGTKKSWTSWVGSACETFDKVRSSSVLNTLLSGKSIVQDLASSLVLFDVDPSAAVMMVLHNTIHRDDKLGRLLNDSTAPILDGMAYGVEKFNAIPTNQKMILGGVLLVGIGYFAYCNSEDTNDTQTYDPFSIYPPSFHAQNGELLRMKHHSVLSCFGLKTNPQLTQVTVGLSEIVGDQNNLLNYLNTSKEKGFVFNFWRNEYPRNFSGPITYCLNIQDGDYRLSVHSLAFSPEILFAESYEGMLLQNTTLSDALKNQLNRRFSNPFGAWMFVTLKDEDSMTCASRVDTVFNPHLFPSFVMNSIDLFVGNLTKSLNPL